MSKYNANRFASLESNDQPPRLTSGTMASLTKAKEVNPNSYSTRFSESRLRDPNYVPPKKPVNIDSSDDFPSLGSKNTVTNLTKTLPVSSSGQNYIDMAKGWGKKIEEEDEANRIRIQNAEILRKKIAKENYEKEKRGIPEKKTTKKKLILQVKKNQYYDKDTVTFKSLDENASDDSFESGPSHEEDEEEDVDETNDDEINANIGKERKHDNELY